MVFEGFVAEGCVNKSEGCVSKGCVTKSAPHLALKLITRGKLTFDERVVLGYLPYMKTRPSRTLP